ncbi:Putative ribonuclease H protein At1g65750 [Linum perenne]
MKVWPCVVNGLQWSIGDGRKTRFWTDRWLDSGILLIDHALNIQGVNPSLSVSAVCSENDGWNSDFIMSSLPRNVALQVLGMSTPRDDLGPDSLVWGLESNGRFSVRSAYQLLNDFSVEASGSNWDYIWRWKGPNKIRHFLWLATHNRLLTNMERQRRHLTNQVFCPRCPTQTETLSHVLFDCEFALQVWRQTLPSAIALRQSASSFESWWMDMLKDTSCNTQFGVIVWLLWNARNKFIFENLTQTATAVSEQCKFWTNLVLSSWKTFQLGREAPGLARQTQLIAWRPGDEGWSTLNTDGSRICHTGATSIGGLIRDEKGGFLRAFCANIGTCSITRAEIKAIVEGLKIAWHIGIRKIAIQSDSKAAVTILQNSEVSTSPHRALIAEFHELRSRDWVVSLSHIFREANCAADHLANFGHSFEFGMYLFDVPDSSLAHWLRYDLIGVALPRAFYSNQ